MNTELLNDLKAIAISASRNSHSPYSSFPVGAACLLADGSIFPGTNIENASFGLTICAERSALFSAFSSRRSPSIELIVIYTPTTDPFTPCGACRQVMLELAANAQLLCFCDGPRQIWLQVHELLPQPFQLDLSTANESLPAEQTSTEVRARRICVDIDNVVAETDKAIREIIYTFTGGRVNLLHDDIIAFNYFDCQDANKQSITQDDWQQVHAIFSQSENISRVEPIYEARDVLTRLSKHFSLHFATARLPEARPATAKWLLQHEFPAHDLHFLRQGEKHESLGRFVVSVEDDANQAISFASAGIPISILVARPWNATCQGNSDVIRLKSWKDIERTVSSILSLAL